MAKMEIILSKDLIDKYINLFDNEEEEKEEALALLLDAYPYNSDEKEVLLKVTVVNSLYSTRLKNNISESKTGTIDVVRMSKRIVRAEQMYGLDGLIASENERDRLKAVELIARDEETDFDDAWSFASKYCSWHNQKVFPIFDKYSRGMIYSIYKTKENGLDGTLATYENVLNYESFCKLYERVKALVNQKYDEDITLKELDKFLWKYGDKHGKVAI